MSDSVKHVGHASAGPSTGPAVNPRILYAGLAALVLAGAFYWLFVRDTSADGPEGLRHVVKAEKGGDVKAIGKLIADPREDIAVRAVQAWGQVAEPEKHVQYLQPALVDSRPKVREQGMLQLSQVNAPVSVEKLSGALTADPAPEVRSAAAKSMGVLRTNDAAAWNALLRGLSDANPDVRHASYGALCQIFRGVRFDYDPSLPPGDSKNRQGLETLRRAVRDWRPAVDRDVAHERGQKR